MLIRVLVLLSLLPTTGMAAVMNPGPEVVQVGLVAPDILCLTVRERMKEPGRQVPYVAAPGDKVERSEERVVRRNGKLYGWLVGRDEKMVYVPDRVTGDKLDTGRIGEPSSYRISSRNDPGFNASVKPVAVFRKSKLTDLARVDIWTFEAPMEHVIYLRLPRPLKAGKKYEMSFAGLPFSSRSFVFDPSVLRSPAVMVSQLGFRPDDPAKIAFLSCWMGDGGPLEYRPGMKFTVVSMATGRAAFEGKTALSKARTDRTEDAYKKNYNGADVYEMDFTALKDPGTYRISVEGVGASFPFEIAPDVWRKSFVVSARGFYHQRNGIELGPPYTEYRRPRCFHPADGVKVYHSDCGLIDSGNGLGEEKTNFGNLIAGKTDRIVENAWGGLMDAGDWDRRIQHLEASRMMLELAETRPAFFAGLALNIPESGNGIPDIVNEALWNLDCYRRMQAPDGGIRGGIESAEHPRQGEASWQESLAVMAYAPDPWSSYVYAGVAARAALVLEPIKPDLAREYRTSALRAMGWAERERSKVVRKGILNTVRDARNLAAAELFRLTGDAGWNGVFLETAAFKDPAAELYVWQKHEQRDAPWVYARTDRPGMDTTVKENCRKAVIREADDRVAQGGRTAYHWTGNPWGPAGWGRFSSPDCQSLIRAHGLTGDAKYLVALVLACQPGTGANPPNLCYTTGVGRQWPAHPLHVDSRNSNQPAPPGITVYGPTDPEKMKDGWEQKLVAPYVYPDVLSWPAVEAYWDIFLYPNMSEYTVMQTMLTTTFAWGYLAAR